MSLKDQVINNAIDNRLSFYSGGSVDSDTMVRNSSAEANNICSRYVDSFCNREYKER